MNYIILFINLFMVTMKKQYIIIKNLALLLLAGGCTIDMTDLNPENFKHENRLFFELQENLYKMDFTQHSKSDMIPFFKIGSKGQWATTEDSSITIRNQGAFDYSHSKVSPFHLSSSNSDRIIHGIFNSADNSDFLLESPINVSSSNFFIYKKYSLDAVFSSRMLPNQLKLIAEYSDDVGEIDIFDLVDEIIELLYLETLQSVEIGFNHQQNYLGSIADWSDEVEPDTLIMNQDSDLSLIEIAINNLQFIVDAAEETLISNIDPIYADDVRSMWKVKKADLYFSLILLFNDFTVGATMPGDILSHNATENRGDSLLWNFNLSDFTENDYTISASSRILYTNRLIALLVIIALLATFVIREKIRN